MKRKQLLPLALLGTVAISAIIPSIAASSGERTYIAALAGNVQIKRRFWWGYRRASINETLWREDRLWVRNGQSAIVICSGSRRRWQVPRREGVWVTEGCAETSYRPADNLAPARDPKNENLPYVINSRNSTLFPDQPLKLTWNPIEGANHYDVEVKYLSRTVLQEQVSEPSIEFQDISDFRRDRNYFVIIRASNGISAPEDPNLDPAPTIALLTDEQVEAVTTSLAEIEALELCHEAEAFAIADLYRSYQLYQGALDVLETVIQNGSENVAIHKMQAEFYMEVDLERFAQQSYLKALAFAEAEDNIAQQAEIQEQLGRIARNLEDFEGAVSWLSKAKRDFQEFLDPEILENREKLAELTELIQDSQNRWNN